MLVILHFLSDCSADHLNQSFAYTPKSNVKEVIELHSLNFSGSRLSFVPDLFVLHSDVSHFLSQPFLSFARKRPPLARLLLVYLNTAGLCTQECDGAFDISVLMLKLIEQLLWMEERDVGDADGVEQR